MALIPHRLQCYPKYVRTFVLISFIILTNSLIDFKWKIKSVRTQINLRLYACFTFKIVHIIISMQTLHDTHDIINNKKAF